MNDTNAPKAAGCFDVRILRQDGPGRSSYWQRYRVQQQPEMNVISVLQKIATHPHTVDGEDVAPVSWDCNCLEEVCGACTMVINGQTRQACSALVDRLLEDHPDQIELRPMTKFPVIRDLMVDRRRLFQSLAKIKAWVAVDGYYDMGPGPRVSAEQQRRAYPLSQCMSCGCCLEACPQYTRLEPVRQADESDEEFELRRATDFDRSFIGAHAIGQAMLLNSHPTGAMNAVERLDALMAPGGIQVCGNAQNCVAVCPKEIPLTTAIAQAGRATTVHAIRRWFER